MTAMKVGLAIFQVVIIGLSSPLSRVNNRVFQSGFMVDEVTLERIISDYFQYYSARDNTHISFIYQRRYIILASHSFITLYDLQQIHGLSQNEVFILCDMLLHLSNYSILLFP
jgi:hypothetical protein